MKKWKKTRPTERQYGEYRSHKSTSKPRQKRRAFFRFDTESKSLNQLRECLRTTQDLKLNTQDYECFKSFIDAAEVLGLFKILFYEKLVDFERKGVLGERSQIKQIKQKKKLKQIPY